MNSVDNLLKKPNLHAFSPNNNNNGRYLSNEYEGDIDHNYDDDISYECDSVDEETRTTRSSSEASNYVILPTRLVKCLSDREQNLSSTKENVRQEVRHIRQGLKLNYYPDKLVRKYVRKSKNKIKIDSSDCDNIKNNNNNNSDINDDMHVKYAQDNTSNKESKSSLVIPYSEETSETLTMMTGITVAGIQTNHKLN
ncbi:unnamed protein product [Trichobilharzia regenti]|nr:unnamed protein product [Trichobilharzia regenti]